jgi:hypothetical protein
MGTGPSLMSISLPKLSQNRSKGEVKSSELSSLRSWHQSKKTSLKLYSEAMRKCYHSENIDLLSIQK